MAQTDKSFCNPQIKSLEGRLEPYSTFANCLFSTLNAFISREPGSSFLGSEWLLGCSGNRPLCSRWAPHNSVAQTTIQVTTTQQGVTDPSHCSLQEAIYAAEFASNTALNLTDPDTFYSTGCELQGGSPPFTIALQKTVYSFNTFWDRDAHNPFGLTATPIIFTNITIQGNGATLQWTGSGNSRLFAVGTASIFDTLDNKPVSGTGALTLESVYIKGFKIKGGDGACGGGGGLGAGGAIYVGTVGSDVPTLMVENSTFDSNFAVGGNGSAHPRLLATPYWWIWRRRRRWPVRQWRRERRYLGGRWRWRRLQRKRGPDFGAPWVEAAEVAPSSMVQTVASTGGSGGYLCGGSGGGTESWP